MKIYRITEDRQGLHLAKNGRDIWRLPRDFFGAVSSAIDPEQHNGSLLLHRKIKAKISCSTDWKLEEGKEGVRLSGCLRDSARTQWHITFTEDEGNLHFFAEMAGPYSELVLRILSDPEEAFYGFGEQFTYFDMSGQAFDLCTSEQGVGRGAQPISFLANLACRGAAGDAFTTYAPMPYFATSRCRALLCEENTLYHFNVKKEVPDRISFSAFGQTLHGILFDAETPLALLEACTAVTGRLRPLPEWAYGTILGIRGGKKKAMEVLENCLAHGTPVRALWIEDWEGRRGKDGGPPLWWRWLPDETLYPDFRNWAAELKSRGIALLGYANPFLSADERNPLYLEGKEKGYFIRCADGSVFTDHYFNDKSIRYVCVDLTDPAAYAWLKEKMRTGMLENGLSGWMADYGEYTPLKGKTQEKDILKAHCELPVLWAKLNSELIDETGNRGKVLTFHRSAGMFSSRYATAYWAGDQDPTFDAHDGLLSGLNGLLTAGISGMSINHTDIGGFTTVITPVYSLVRKKEVMMRWLEFAAFTPVFRTHDGAYTNKKNYQFYDDEDGYAMYARMAKIHEALGFYFQKLEKEAAGYGWPMVRALWLHYPKDPACRRLNREFLLGEDILVSPAAAFGATEVETYLPQGEWRNPYDGMVYEGGCRKVLPAEIGKPPVLIRKGAPDEARLAKAICGESGKRSGPAAGEQEA